MLKMALTDVEPLGHGSKSIQQSHASFNKEVKITYRISNPVWFCFYFTFIGTYFAVKNLLKYFLRFWLYIIHRRFLFGIVSFLTFYQQT